MRYFILLIAVFLSSIALAQVKEGKLIYERKMNLHRDLPPGAEQYKEMVPEFSISKMELLFNATQSLFHLVPAEEADEMPSTEGGDGRRMVVRIGGMDAETFRDYDKELMVEGRELGPKKYIIEDTLRPLKWKLEEDTMTILGYLCHKATTSIARRSRGPAFIPGADSIQNPGKTSEQPVEAWYTAEIESAAGPENFYGLPGLILKTDINNGTIVFTATNFTPLEKDVVKAPANGKKVTRAEFRKMMETQARSMSGGPGGGAVIRVIQ